MGKQKISGWWPVLGAMFAGLILVGAKFPHVPSLEDRLADEVFRMVEAGHLRPGINIVTEKYQRQIDGQALDFYNNWHNPAETIYTLMRVLPHLPNGPYPSNPAQTWVEAVEAYAQNEFAAFPSTQTTHMGASGAPREHHTIPPAVVDWAASYQIRKDPGVTTWEGWSFNPFNFYAVWQYAAHFGNAADLLDDMRSQIAGLPSDDFLQYRPHVLNVYIAGYYGFLGLQDLAGEAPDATVQGWLDNALQKKVAFFAESSLTESGYEAGGFLFLVPELADYLHQHADNQVRQRVTQWEAAAPYWFVARAPEGIRHSPHINDFNEGSLSSYYDYASLFNAKALALREPREVLERYLDCPSVWRGDLYYIQNLVSAIEAGPGGNQRPFVSAGPDQELTLPNETAALAGAVSDDGLPTGQLTVAWSQLQGPAPAQFRDNTAPVTDVSLPAVGTYLLRLSASDGELDNYDDVIVRVIGSGPGGGDADVVSDGSPTASNRGPLKGNGCACAQGRSRLDPGGTLLWVVFAWRMRRRR